MKRYIVTLTFQEQEKLRGIIAEHNSQAEVKRAFVLLSLDEASRHRPTSRQS